VCRNRDLAAERARTAFRLGFGTKARCCTTAPKSAWRSVPFSIFLSRRMASAPSSGAAPVPRHRHRCRKGGTEIAGCIDRAVSNRESQEGDQAQCRRSAGHGLCRTHRSSRHTGPQHHAHATSARGIASLSIPNRRRSSRQRSTCSVSTPLRVQATKKPGHQIVEPNQAFVRFTSENFRLIIAPPPMTSASCPPMRLITVRIAPAVRRSRPAASPARSVP